MERYRADNAAMSSFLRSAYEKSLVFTGKNTFIRTIQLPRPNNFQLFYKFRVTNRADLRIGWRDCDSSLFFLGLLRALRWGGGG
jgi:hypothetical protein